MLSLKKSCLLFLRTKTEVYGTGGKKNKRNIPQEGVFNQYFFLKLFLACQNLETAFWFCWVLTLTSNVSASALYTCFSSCTLGLHSAILETLLNKCFHKTSNKKQCSVFIWIFLFNFCREEKINKVKNTLSLEIKQCKTGFGVQH